jgi:hypothetical protein
MLLVVRDEAVARPCNLRFVSLPEFWFGPPPALADNEQWVAHLAANRSQGKRAVGGGLHVTTERLLFCPNAIDARLGGKPWSCTRAEVAGVGVQRPSYSPLELFSGGLVDRLRFDLNDGRRELFVVSRPGAVAATLRELLQASESGGELPVARVIK